MKACELLAELDTAVEDDGLGEAALVVLTGFSDAQIGSQPNPREFPIVEVMVDDELRQVNLLTASEGESKVTTADLVNTLRGLGEGSDDFEVLAEGAAQISEDEWTVTPSEPILILAKDRTRNKVGLVPWFMEFNDVFGH